MEEVKSQTQKKDELRLAILKQLITLSTAGFGLVAALAWNEAIQGFVKEYIDKYLAVGTGILSHFIYAVLITLLAVLITYQLSKLVEKLEAKIEKE